MQNSNNKYDTSEKNIYNVQNYINILNNDNTKNNEYNKHSIEEDKPKINDDNFKLI